MSGHLIPCVGAVIKDEHGRLLLIKRGQTIAKSGQSGNVASPQLHFELRKGTKPVDPTQYLAGA